MKKFFERYPNLTSALKRFLRIFLNTFLVTAFAFIESFDGGSLIVNSFKTGFSHGMNSLFIVLIGPLFLSSSIAGIAAVAKYLRTIYPEIKSNIFKLIANIF